MPIIYWSFQPIDGAAASGDPAAATAFLGEEERQIYAHFKVAKRRMEWLGGRLAVKDLVRRADPRCSSLERSQVQILYERGRVPRLAIPGIPEVPGRISISHSNGHVFVLYSPNVTPMGLDLEIIEPRSPEFVEDFFTAPEVALVKKQPVEEQPLWTNLIWSSKEAVLKALSLGLRVDTRSVEVFFPGSEPLMNGWQALGMQSGLVKQDSLHLFWRREANFVLTVCIPAPGDALHRLEA